MSEKLTLEENQGNDLLTKALNKLEHKEKELNTARRIIDAIMASMPEDVLWDRDKKYGAKFFLLMIVASIDVAKVPHENLSRRILEIVKNSEDIQELLTGRSSRDIHHDDEFNLAIEVISEVLND